MYAQVEKGGDQDLFVYSVQKCYATKDNDPSDDTNSDSEDVFFEEQCPKDETMDFAVDGGDFFFTFLFFITFLVIKTF